MNKEILKVGEVSLSYDNKKTYILKDISFSVNSGEILSIIGVNGTGKSSLLKILAGIKKMTSGTIVRKYKGLSYVPQKIEIDNTFPIKVREFIKIYNKGIKNDTIINYFHKFHSENLIEMNISDLSGGQMQKVLIVTALISNPDLILLDEPTAGIDVIGEEKFYKIITELKKEFPKLSIILVSHNINLVYKNSDKVICLHRNNFCCHGTPAEMEVNSDVKEIFGNYMLPYEHHPHKKDNHHHKKHKHT